MHNRSVEHAAEGNSRAELQDLAQKLAALAKQIKTIAATPIGETVCLDENIEAPRQISVD